MTGPPDNERGPAPTGRPPSSSTSHGAALNADRTPSLQLDSEPMTKAERTELAQLVRRHERTAKAGVDYRVAEVMADVEAQLSATYRSDNAAWAEITETARQAVADADEAVAARCAEMGIRAEFRPKLTVGWYSRGENGVDKRRAELRAAAKARLDQEAKRARHEIAVRTDEVLTELTAGALHSEAAKAFLQSIPTPAALLPTFDVAQLEGGHP